MTEQNESHVRVRWGEPAADPANVTYHCLGCYTETRDGSVFDEKGLCPRCRRIVTPGVREPTD